MDVNLRDKYGRTALMWAAEQGHVAAIETLLDLGADRTIRDSHTNRSADHKIHKSSKTCQASSSKLSVAPVGLQQRSWTDPMALKTISVSSSTIRVI